MPLPTPTELTGKDWDWYRRSLTDETFVDMAKKEGVKVGIIRYRVRKCQKALGELPVEPDQDEIRALADADARWTAIIKRPKAEAMLGLPPEGYSALSEKRAEEERRKASIADEFALRKIFIREHSTLDRGYIRMSDIRERMHGC
jgi:hypothetical protein